jgi:PKHD-type hydroxylase
MFLIIPDLLDAATVAHLRAELPEARWESGLATTGAAGHGRKRNVQIAADEPRLGEWRQLILQAFARHPMVRFLVLPKYIMPPMFNRYDAGMYYRDHVDYPLPAIGEGALRADLSFTVFLSPPDAYEGGELIVGLSSGERRVKLPVGQAIVYPASTLHRVEPVRSGVRLGAVGTIQSRVRGEAERALIADMVALWNRIETREPDGDEVRLAKKIHHNLVRLWAD